MGDMLACKLKSNNLCFVLMWFCFELGVDTIGCVWDSSGHEKSIWWGGQHSESETHWWTGVECVVW